MVTPEPPTIEAQRLTKVYGRLTAIRDVTFSVARGEVVGFLGPNGAGKSTTLRILCGLVPATSGVARVGGIPVALESRAARQRLGYMPENNPLPEDLRVEEYLRFRARIKEVPGREVRRRVEEVMELCDLGRKARRRLIGTLSKGFRQRVGVADAMLGNPEVAILDEPTIGLDPHQILLFRELLNRLRGRMTVVLSSHILSEIEVSCDRVIIMNQGRIVASGTHEGLRREFFPLRRWCIEVAGPAAAVAAGVRRVCAGAEIDDPAAADGAAGDGFRKVQVSASAGVDLLESVWEELRGSGVRVRGAAAAEPSLEEVFLAATRRSWDETGPVEIVAETRDETTEAATEEAQ